MIDRIKQVMDYSGLTPAQFATEIGINRSGLTHLFSGRNQPSLDLIKKILVAFPQIKTEWLMMGMGSMLKNGEQSVSVNNPIEEPKEPDLFSQIVLDKIPTVPSISNSSQSDPDNDKVVKNDKNIKNNISQRESNKPILDPMIDKIFNSREDKKVKKIVLLYSDHTFDVYQPNE